LISSLKRVTPATCALIAILFLAACGNSATLTGAQVLQKANAHLPKSGTYTMTGKINQGAGIDVTGAGKFIAEPGQSSLSVNYSASGVATTVDVVADEDHVYIRESTSGKWMVDAVGTLEENSPINYEIVQPVLAGTDTIQGVTAYHLTGKNNEGADVAFWFRTDTYYPVKATLGSLGSANFKDVTLTYANLDSPVTITVPTVN